MSELCVCSTCRYWQRQEDTAVGVCRRFPESLDKGEADWCGEHKIASPTREILDTDLVVAGVSIYTRNTLAHLKVKTVEDALLAGRYVLADKRVIAEVEKAFTKLGVWWGCL